MDKPLPWGACIVGAYDLDLYCQQENDSHSYKEFPHKFSDNLRGQCYAQARKAGWRLDLKNQLALCPKCVKAKRH